MHPDHIPTTPASDTPLTNHPAITRGTPACRDPATAASYARTASGRGADAAIRLHDQHARNAHRAAADGVMIPPQLRFGDAATSGTTLRRAGLEALFALLESHVAVGDVPPFDRLYVTDTARLCRGPNQERDRDAVLHRLRAYGVSVVFGSDPGPDHGRHDLSLAIEPLAAAATAAAESARRRRRLASGMLRTAEAGFYPGGRAPYGTARQPVAPTAGRSLPGATHDDGTRRCPGRHRLVWLRDGSVAVVREIFDRIEAGETLRQIASSLPSHGNAGAWTANKVRCIARNPLYCGDLAWGPRRHDAAPGRRDRRRELLLAFVVPDFMRGPPIRRAQWARVQAILDQPGSGRRSRQ